MLRDNANRAKEAINALWVTFGFQFILIFSDLQELFLINEIENIANTGGNALLLQEKADTIDVMVRIVAIVSIIITIVTGILFIRWFRRAYYNLHLLKKHLTYTEGWAAGGWFVPIMGLIIPYRIMKELFTETRSIFILKDKKTENLSDNMLPIWWALFILGNVLNYVAFRLANSSNDFSGFYASSIISIIANSIELVAACITVIIIRKYADAERVLRDITQLTTESTTFSKTPKVINQ